MLKFGSSKNISLTYGDRRKRPLHNVFMTLGEKIRAAREAQGLKQGGLAKALGIKESAVSQWESGRTVPESSRWPDIRRILKKPTSYFLDDEEDFSEAGPATQNVAPAPVTPPVLNEMRRDLPVLGTAAGSVSGAIQIEHDPVDYVRRPSTGPHSAKIFASAGRENAEKATTKAGKILFMLYPVQVHQFTVAPGSAKNNISLA